MIGAFANLPPNRGRSRTHREEAVQPSSTFRLLCSIQGGKRIRSPYRRHIGTSSFWKARAAGYRSIGRSTYRAVATSEPNKGNMMITNLFLAHPRTVGESYFRHGATAARFGGTMIMGGLACLVHAAIPALFTNAASDCVKRLYLQMRARQPNFAATPTAFQAPAWQLEYEI